MKIDVKVFSFFLLVTLTTVFLAGCGQDSDDLLLAEVGDDKITSGLLDEVVENSGMTFDSFEDELNYRRAILDSLVIQSLLIQEAYRLNIDELEEVNRLVLGNRDKFLLDILYIREIEDKIDIDESEIRQYYDNLEYKVQVSHILLATEDTALMVLDSLEKGGNFEDLALAFSRDPSVERNRGDIGYVTWGQVTMPFLEAAFKLQPGEISRPFETKFGWHIAKVTDRVPNENRKNYDFMRPQIEQQIKNMQRDSLMDMFLIELRENHPVSIEEATIEYLMHKRENLYPPQLLETLPKNDFDMAQLDRHEKELVLATWDNGQITLGQYLTEIQQIPMQNRPNLDDLAALQEFIFQMKVMDLLTAEARRKGLEDDPDYKRKLNRFKELTMADVMQNDSIQILNPPTEEEIRQYYDDHLDEFVKPSEVHVFEILVSSEDTASKYIKEIKSLQKFKEVAFRLTERPGKRVKKGDLGYIQRSYYPSIFDLAFDSPVGSIVGPVKYGSQFSIVYVADKRAEEMKDFLAVKPQIDAKLRNERKRESFEQWVENKKQEADIRLYENNIRPGIDKRKYIEADES